MNIQQVSTDANRMLLYQAAQNRGKTAAAPLPILADTAGQTKTQNVPVLLPDNKIPSVDEIKKMIQDDGYPFKSDIYKAIARIVKSDMN